MYVSLTKQEILEIRKKRFPNIGSESQNNEIAIKNAVFKNSGTDTIANIDLQILDKVSDSKIFKNVDNKNALKLKIFEIYNNKMQEEVKDVTDIFTLEKIIKRYGTYSVDLFPCIDFIGSKTDVNQHLDSKNKDLIQLNYKLNFTFPEQITSYLSIGMMFYVDVNYITSTLKIPISYIDKEILNSNIQIQEMFKDNKSANLDIVQDLRTVNKIFKNNELLDKLNERINIDYKLTKQLSQKQPQIDNTQFFSNPYYSRDDLGNMNFLFNLDFKKLVENYSSFSTIIKNTAFPDEVREKCKISSLKIIKRQYDVSKEINKKPILKRELVEYVVDSSQNISKNNNTIIKKDTDNGYINELILFNNLRTFEVRDKKVYKSKTSNYQYGVELKVNDGFPEFLYNQNKLLSNNLRSLKEYLQETSKFVKVYTKNDLIVREGYYDPVMQAFTRQFCEEVFVKEYSTKLVLAISAFLDTLNLFGVLYKEEQQNVLKTNLNNNIAINSLLTNIEKTTANTQTDEKDLASSLISLLNPASATAETIIYFIRIYERLIKQIEKLLSTNKNTSFDVNYWFNKDVLVDASYNPSIGYSFFDDINKTEGLGKINNLQFEQKLALEIQKYTNSNSISPDEEEEKFSCISPSKINSKNKSLSLKDTEGTKNIEFTDLELDIKRYNLLGDAEKQIDLDATITSISKEEQNIKLKTEKALNKFSFLTNNLFLDSSKNKVVKDKSVDSKQVQNEQINPNYLFLGMLKSTKKTNFTRNPSIIDATRNGILTTDLRKEPGFVPFQIKYLLNKKDLIFSTNNIKYLKDLENNSKYLFLYNTLHMVEVLQYSNENVRNEKWVKLTKTYLNNIPQGASILCRLNLYQNSGLGFNNFENISLPIYDKYFILQKTATAANIQGLLQNLRRTFENSFKNKIATLNINPVLALPKIEPQIQIPALKAQIKKPLVISTPSGKAEVVQIPKISSKIPVLSSSPIVSKITEITDAKLTATVKPPTTTINQIIVPEVIKQTELAQLPISSVISQKITQTSEKPSKTESLTNLVTVETKQKPAVKPVSIKEKEVAKPAGRTLVKK